MTELPSIFDSKGAFLELPSNVLDSLDDARAVTYQKIRRCAADLKVADSAVAASIETCKTCTNALVEFENFVRKTFPKMTFHQLWKQVVKGE